MKSLSWVVLLLSAHTVWAQAGAGREKNTIMLDSLIQSYMDLSGTVGMSVAIADNKQLLYTKGFGWSDIDQSIPVTRETVFRTASVAKVITASLLGVMMDEKKIDIDKPVNNYLRQPFPYGDQITSRMLVSHTAGIRHYIDRDFRFKNIDLTNFSNMEEALSIFKKDSLVSPPGERYNYTTFGFTLLGAVMERAAGKPFINRMQEMLNQLGMYNTFPMLSGIAMDYETKAYSYNNKKQLQRHRLLRPSYKYPGGGYLSTSEDLILLGQHYLNHSFLSDSTYLELFTRTVTKNKDTLGIGLGWIVAKDPWERDIYFHNGGQTGARTVLMIYPNDNLTIAMMSNTSNQPQLIEGFAACIADMVLTNPAIVNTPVAQNAPDTAFMGEYDYFWENNLAQIKGNFSLYAGPQGNIQAKMSESNQAAYPVLAIQNPKTDTLKGKIATPQGVFPLELKKEGNNWRGWYYPNDTSQSQRIAIWMQKRGPDSGPQATSNK